MAETTQWLTFYDKQRALLSLGIFGKYAVFLYRTLSLEAVLARRLTIYSENNAESTFKQIVCVCVCVCLCVCATVRMCVHVIAMKSENVYQVNFYFDMLFPWAFTVLLG